MNLLVDASVAVKWFFAENLNEEADRLLTPLYELYAPDFLLLEVSSVIWKKRQRNEWNPVEDAEIFAILRDSIHEWIPLSTLSERALQLAHELGHSVYDCVYLAAAESISIKLITADRDFYNRVLQSPYSPLIAWIEDSSRHS